MTVGEADVQFQRTKSYASSGMVSFASERRHCFGRLTRRGCMWAICSGAAFVAILVATLLFFFIGGKAIAQSSVDNAQVQVHSLYIFKEKGVVSGSSYPDVTIQMDLSVISNYVVSATIEDSPIQFVFANEPFGEVVMPSLKLKASSFNDFSQRMVMTIMNKRVFDKFSQAVLLNTSIPLEIRGKVAVSPSMLPTIGGLDFVKSVQVSGFEGFTSMPPQLSSLEFGATPSRQYDGWNDNLLWANVSVVLSNPATVNMQSVGRVAGLLLYEGTEVGRGYSLGDVAVKKGADNVVALEIQLLKTPTSARKLKDLVTRYMNGVPTSVLFQATRTDSEVWKNVVQSLSFEIPLPGAANRQDKFFQIFNQLIDITPHKLLASPKDAQITYCQDRVKVPQFNGQTLFGGGGTPAFYKYNGRFLPLNVFLKNNMGIDVTLSNINATLYIQEFNINSTSGAPSSTEFTPYARFASFAEKTETKFDAMTELTIKAHNMTSAFLPACMEALWADTAGQVTEKSVLGILDRTVFPWMARIDPAFRQIYPQGGLLGTQALDFGAQKLAQSSAPATVARLVGSYSIEHRPTNFKLSGIEFTQSDINLIVRLTSFGSEET